MCQKIKKVKSFIAFGLILGLMCCYSCITQDDRNTRTTHPGTYIIQGYLENLQADYLILKQANAKYPNNLKIDTIPVINGNFRFEDSCASLVFNKIPIRQTFKRVDENIYLPSAVSQLQFFTYPGADITVHGTIGDYVDAYPEDESINSDLAKINSEIYPYLNSMANLKVDAVVNHLSDSLYQANRDSINKLNEIVIDKKIAFIEKNASSPVSSYLLLEAYTNSDIVEELTINLLNNLDENKLGKDPFYNALRTRINAIGKTKKGALAPIVSTDETLNGMKFSLSSLQGNYVLLDFWGSWCGPCMAELPKLKQLEKQIENRNFKIVGINSGDSDQRWRETVKDQELNWIHIRSTETNNLLVPYNVNFFPTKFLISPEGTILYNSKTDKDTDLYDLIAELDFANNIK